MAGKLIVFEGANEVGKSTLAALLFTDLRRHGVPCELIAFPGNAVGTLGRHVYELHHGFARFGIERIVPTSLQLLHIAAHIDAIEQTIIPALESGCVVLLDRFWWSALVYGAASGADPISIESMVSIERHHWRNILPNLIILVRRAAPVTPLYDAEEWQKLVSLYSGLAKREKHTCRIEEISNDGAVDETFGILRALLSGIV